MLMKRLFTKLLKYRALALMGGFLLAGIVSAYAEEYKSLIRYDRIWEHLSINWRDGEVYYVKFDGPEEINGKTYHRLVSFRKASFEYEYNLQPYLFDIDNEYYRHEGYMREEEGKVYTLIYNVGYDENGRLYGRIYTSDGKEVHPADLQEKLLYDFTCKEGESYLGLQVYGHTAEEMNYKVKSVESVEIDGEENRRMYIYHDDEWDNENAHPIVEGIGIASYGCLTTINFLYLPSCPCMDHIFNRVLSTDGKVLYTNDVYHYVDIPLGDFLGVGSLTDEPSDAAPIYDLYGRLISTPASGQIYIQGGKKYIGK